MLELIFFTLINFNQPLSLEGTIPTRQELVNLIQPSPVPQKKEQTLRPQLLGRKEIAVWAQDLRSGKVLFKKDAYRPQPIASLTKIMVFLIIYQDHDLDEVVSVSREATLTDGAQIDLYEYEKLTVRTLLEAILIPSANDAAKALAIHHSGSEEEFAKVMNQKAREWGFRTATFYNATGLDMISAPPGAGGAARRSDGVEDSGGVVGNTMSAYELALLTRRALRIPFFRETVQETEFFGTSVDERFAHSKSSTNQLLGSFLGTRGVKTGYTQLAGQCLIHLSEREDGVQILSVVLGSPDRFQETKNILTWIWDNFVWR